MATFTNSSPFQGSENVLLKEIKTPEFKLTLKFEKLLVETLCKQLNNVVDTESRGSVVNLVNCLDCVMAVADKDDKFIHLYFGNKENTFYEKLTTLLSIKFNFLILLAADLLIYRRTKAGPKGVSTAFTYNGSNLLFIKNYNI